MSPTHIVYPTPSLPSLHHHCRVQNTCTLLKTPATTDILCGIKWANLSHELSLFHACAILNFDASLFPQGDKWDGKFSRQKTRLPKALASLSSTAVSELNGTPRRDAISKSRRFGLSENGDICVERHYDNERSLSITSTSWAPFPLMYFSEGNSLWQSYLLHCIAGLFLEVTFKNSATENICDDLYQSHFP